MSLAGRGVAPVAAIILLLSCAKSPVAGTAEVGLGIGRAVWIEDESVDDIIIDTVRVMGGYHINRVLGLEAYASVTSWGTKTEGIDFDTSGNLMIRLPIGRRFLPFGSIGAGAAIRSLEFLVNCAMGAEIGITDNLGIRMEYRTWSTYNKYDSQGVWYLDFVIGSVSISISCLL